MNRAWTLSKTSRTTLGIFAIFTLSMTACTAIPIYQPPSDIDNSAHIKVSFEDESRLAGVATVSKIEGDIICGEPLPNLERMIVISKGNPLISNINPSGTYIQAGQKFTFSVVGLSDGFKGCGRIVSFTPESGRQYEIGLINKTLRNPHNESIPCPVQVYEVSQDKNSKKPLIPVVVTYEECSTQK